MENSQEEIKKAILNIAKHIGLSERYNSLLKNEAVNIKLLVKELIIDMFIEGFNFEKCASQIFNSYMIILNFIKLSHSNFK